MFFKHPTLELLQAWRLEDLSLMPVLFVISDERLFDDTTSTMGSMKFGSNRHHLV
jgi:hypothetical protein